MLILPQNNPSVDDGSQSVGAIFTAVVWRDVPNPNHFCFCKDELVEFAASFEGAPFIKNHVLTPDSHEGTILGSRLVGDEIHQTIEVTTWRGIHGLRSGAISRFSVGWYFDAIECSVCKGNWFDCPHETGHSYGNQLCSLLFLGARGKETSAVRSPAISGTRILDVLGVGSKAITPYSTHHEPPRLRRLPKVTEPLIFANPHVAVGGVA